LEDRYLPQRVANQNEANASNRLGFTGFTPHAAYGNMSGPSRDNTANRLSANTAERPNAPVRPNANAPHLPIVNAPSNANVYYAPNVNAPKPNANMAQMPNINAPKPKPDMEQMPNINAPKPKVNAPHTPNANAVQPNVNVPNVANVSENVRPNVGGENMMNMPEPKKKHSAHPCSDKEGTLPSCAPLAVGFIPFQQENPPQYKVSEALTKGTLFPGLDLPWFNVSNTSNPYEGTPLGELMALSFAIKELNLYLDTHKNDAEALDMLKKLNKLYVEATEKFNKMYGPMMVTDITFGDEYTWLQDPWPWEFGQRGGSR